MMTSLVLAVLAAASLPFDFEGNVALDTGALREAAARADATPAESEDTATERRAQWILAAYYDHGYADAKVTPVRVADPRPHVVFRIAEGKPYRIGHLAVRGDVLGLVRLPTRDGDLFVRERIVEALTEAKAAYAARGHVAVEIVPSTHKDDRRRTLDLVFDVTPGPKDAPPPMR